MNKVVFWCLIGFGIALAIGFVIGFLGGAAGIDFGFAPWVLGGLLGAFVAYIGGNLAGNRKVETASADVRDKALAFDALPGHALLIVYREGFVGMAAGMNVVLDGKIVAQLKSPRFTALNLSEGDHTLSFGFGGLAGAQNNAAEVRVPVIAGQVIALKAAMAMGAMKNTITVEWVEAYPSELRERLKSMKMVAAEQN